MNIPLKKRVRTQPPSAGGVTSVTEPDGGRPITLPLHGSHATGKKLAVLGRSATAKSHGRSDVEEIGVQLATVNAGSMITRKPRLLPNCSKREVRRPWSRRASSCSERLNGHAWPAGMSSV